MSVKDWLELEHDEKTGSFDLMLESINTVAEDEIQSLVTWFIDTLSMDEQKKILLRDGKDEKYLEQLDFFIEHLLSAIVEGVYVATGVKL